MNREIVVEIQGRNYICKYPTVGQMIDLSVRESTLAKGTLRDLILQGTGEQQDAYLFIKSVAFFEVMMPELVSSLKVPLLDLDPFDFMEINKVYWDKIDPWLTEWKQKLQNPLSE